ncbi:sulfite exporter TauE/SafE family protein [Leptospira sp. 201903070]|uniref:Probable membrane transporter protein n=1 Tax=Leptospira ainlahdjerensis TaxID=2810033 RepID=A0ABS2UCK8_9LEPT|nr:sulfite exporter TauE/SafE family protein [Leptospira ainlahdjerensis]MBM9578111.1 sulfite exporter TauE/SafE family protein [Leptospira ainlahdjerensis]
MLILGYIAAFLMGTSFGLIGAGGSILMVPILFYLFGQNAIQATTNSLFVVGVTALIGALIKAKSGHINLRTGFLFAMPGFVGIYIAKHFILASLPDILIHRFGFTLTKSLLVMTVFAIIMAFSSWAMIRSGSSAAEEGSPPIKATSSNFVGIGFKGLTVGAITGFVGAGGGFLIIPALALLLKFPLNVAVGTSLAIIAANSLFGFAISFSSVQFEDCPLLLTVSILGIGGMFFGQILSSKMEERYLRRGFGYFVFVAAFLILWDQSLRF